MSMPVRPARPLSQRLFGMLLGVLAVLLPGLVAGVQLNRPATEAELARLRLGLAVAATPQPAPLAAHVLYAAALTGADEGRLDREPEVVVRRARFVMVWLLFGIGGLLYLLLSVSRGGMTALFACLVLSTLPPVVEDGCVLRPEPLACAFGLLGTVLLMTYALAVLLRTHRGRVRRALLLGLVAALAGGAYGVAAAALSRASVLLLVPAGVITLACAVQTWRWWRAWRRRRLTRGVLLGLARGSWPWFCLAAVGMAACSAVLFLLAEREVIATLPTASAFGYLPSQWPRAALVSLLLLIGGLRLLFYSGAQLSARRLHPSLVLLLFCTLTLMQFALTGGGVNALLPACAAAALAGEGATTLIVLLVGALYERTRRASGSGG